MSFVYFLAQLLHAVSAIPLSAPTPSASSLDERTSALPPLQFIHIPKNAGSTVANAGKAYGFFWGLGLSFDEWRTIIGCDAVHPCTHIVNDTIDASARSLANEC